MTEAVTGIGDGLIQLSSLVQGIFARVSERHRLTPVQARLLCVLVERPWGMAELSRLFGVEKAALTGLMDRVERGGLAQRESVPGDRRALQVILTDAGRKAAIAFHADVGVELERLVSWIEPDEREQFQKTLSGILRHCRD